MFIDHTKVELIAGSGGRGAIHFRREKYISKGGPDGGDGGRGGHIIFKVDSNLHTLQDIKYQRKYAAGDGASGGGNRKTGKNGKDIIVFVPEGTLIKNSEDKTIVADLINNGENFLVCSGGKGGRGNIRFKSSTNQSPRKAQPGLPGESGIFDIELKVLADVGLVGLPNAGKSTLLSRLSSARPKIADYPFTTLEPKLGIVKYGDFSSFVMADIPGIIKGASKGKGLGHQFLKHIERNKILVYLIDSTDPSPYTTYKTLEQEIINFNKDLMIKTMIVCRTKSDIKLNPKSDWSKINKEIFEISSITGEGLDNLIAKIVSVIN
tara:strand:+ start:2046 stop:3011 length:966 start_codon:yes stop_codon:yes gene_type:complete